MKYSGVKYYVDKGVEVSTWKFETSMNEKIPTVRAKSKEDAAKVVERTIDKALTPKKRSVATRTKTMTGDQSRQTESALGKRWYVSFVPAGRRSRRTAQTFETENQAKAFALKLLATGRAPSAGTMNPHLPKRTI